MRAMKMDVEAMESFNAALKLDPQYSEAHLNISFLYASVGELEKAKAEMALEAKCDKRMDLGPMLKKKRKPIFHKKKR